MSNANAGPVKAGGDEHENLRQRRLRISVVFVTVRRDRNIILQQPMSRDLNAVSEQ